VNFVSDNFITDLPLLDCSSNLFPPCLLVVTNVYSVLKSLRTMFHQQVRTRAVTLQKYICSSEDILKYASKLLKAELPVSLRLIGTTQYVLNILCYENSSIFINISMERG
jgi:hypothetical protein